ncbi:MAG TPA: hypothetical protein DDW52_20600 [Planctomycetaceae bacterium]|nr:hypothetical protein [Planctomycetaceae bacterium]
MHVRTLSQALKYVEKVKICTVMSSKSAELASLWDAVDLPDDEGETKWGRRVEAIWRWKNELPHKYPDRIFYGKLPGGLAALMTIAYLRDTHYPSHHQSVEACRPLAQDVFTLIRRSSGATTAAIRREAIELYGCTKSQFDTALKQLQTTLNVARVNSAPMEPDAWVPFTEMYIDVLQA